LVVDVHHLDAHGPQARAGIQAPKVHHRDLFDAKASEVVFDTGPELFGSLRGTKRKGAARVGVSADLAHDDDATPRAEGLADEPVDKAVAVELGGVDMVDTQFDRAA